MKRANKKSQNFVGGRGTMEIVVVNLKSTPESFLSSVI